MSDLTVAEKVTICNWQNKLSDCPGATSTMVESLLNDYKIVK